MAKQEIPVTDAVADFPEGIYPEICRVKDCGQFEVTRLELFQTAQLARETSHYSLIEQSEMHHQMQRNL